MSDRLHCCEDCAFETPSYPDAVRHTDGAPHGHLTVAWIVHDERRRHLPDLASECVRCLQAEVLSLRAGRP